MSNKLYLKLAADNIRKNGRTYIPYIITCIITIAMFYIIRSLSLNEGLQTLKTGAFIMSQILGLGSIVVGIFSVIFLFYTNSFLMKRRKKEFGLYNILGMEKKHISRVIAFETLYVSVISILLGLAAGFALDKVMYMLMAKIMKADIHFGFYISLESVITSVVLFGIIFFCILLNSLRQIHLSKPIELLKGSNVGEKEPKTKLITAFLGVLFLIGGYFIAVEVKNVMEAMTFFFYAVILVIIGTYMIFTSGSIFFLKKLRKNKKYYYKTKHFISVSGMIYRMKQNAVGLANICILSTMVLVMISSTVSLMVGIDDIINMRYPDFDIQVYTRGAYMEGENGDKLKNLKEIEEIMDQYSDCTVKKGDYLHLSFNCSIKGNKLLTEEGENDISCQFILLEDHNKYSGETLTLGEDEVYLIGSIKELDSGYLEIFGKSFSVKNRLYVKDMDNYGYDHITVYVKDMDALQEINDLYNDAFGLDEPGCWFDRTINYDIKDSGRAEEIIDRIYGVRESVSIEDSYTAREDFMELYGGLFFLGIFLGTLFVMATILIIYYKQISEGYEDKNRFEIMRKVGMSKSEVKASIHSQVLCVFFLPLITAGIHICFAFPMVSKMLAGLELLNTSLYIICTIASFLVFAFMYVMIYLITAKVYYKIVSK